jgi:integrase
MPTHLIDRVVQALTPPTGGKKDKLVFDDRLPCLAVRVGANGRKTFLFQARQKDGRQIRQALGRFPAVTTARARDLAKAKAGRIASGADLHAEAAERKAKSARRKTDSAFTVSDLVDEWIQAPKKKGAAKRPSYARGADRRLRRVLKASLTMPAASVTFDDLAQACDTVDKPAARHAAVIQVKTLFRWAKSKRRIAHNPAIDLELPEPPASRNRCLESEEAQAVWRVAGRIEPPYGPYTRFLQGTCVRRGEAAQARWSEFDDDLTLWSIPASRMKTGRPHLVPLPPSIRDLLRALPRFAWSDLVFSADGRRLLGGFSHLKKRIDEALIADGVKIEPWRLHDFRRSAVSWMASEGIDITVADLLLAHGVSSLSTVGAVYQKFQWIDERRSALERWTGFLNDRG